MPDATITSTASTFGTISGVFSADQSTISGTISGIIPGTLTGSVGVPGPAGAAGAPGQGVPVGGSSGQFLQKTSGADYATDWVTVNLSVYLTKADNLGSLTNFATARDNLSLGVASTPTFAGVNVPGSGTSVANLGATFLTINQSGHGQFTIQPSQGIVFPNGTIQTTAFTGVPADFITSVSSPLSVTSGNLSIDLSAYLTTSTAASTYYPLTNPSAFITASALTPYLTTSTASATYQTLAGMSSYLTTSAAASTYQTLSGMSAYLTTATAATSYYPLSGNPSGFLTSAPVTSVAGRTGAITLSNTDISGLGGLAVINDAPSDGSQYARKNGAWDIVSAGASYISSVSSPLSVTSGNLSIDLSAYAPLASPVFTGDARAVTATFGDNDTSIATTAFVQAGLAGGTAVAKNLEVEVRNQSGSTIPAGSIVYISGATGNKPLITLAQANNDANSAQTMGFTATAIANNAAGYVIVRGECQNLDTSALTEGVQLYLSPTVAGSYTTTKPSAPQHLVYVGIVIRSHPTLGTILVAVQNGYELGEIHDVALGTLVNNDLLAYESSTDLWKNKTYSALGLLTSADAATTYAPIASPTFTGDARAVTPATSDNDTSIATTAFVKAQGYLTSAPVTSVAGRTGAITLAVGDVSNAVSLDGTQTITGAKTFTNANLTFGNSTASGVIAIASGANGAGISKSLYLGTGANNAGSVTEVIIGANVGSSSTTLQGNTSGVTLAVDSNNTLLATTAYVVGQAGSATPLVNGTAAVGTSLRYARQDHVHGTDTTRAPLASPALTGTPTAPTATLGTNTTQIATTAFVLANAPASAVTSVAGRTGAVVLAVADISGAAPLASPTFTGTVTIPSGASISGYLTTTAGDAAYYPLTGNPSGFLTSAPVTSVAGRTGAITLANTDISGLGTMSTATAADYSTTTVANGLYYPLSGNPSGFLTSAPVSSVAGRTGAITLAVADVSGAAPLASPSFSGTPSLPTGTTAVTQTAGNNTTAVATTAFVSAAIPSNNVKAWVNFNGTGTVAIRASMNVSSITDNSTGNYTVNFTAAMADTNYATIGRSAFSTATSEGITFGVVTSATSSVRISTKPPGQSITDPVEVSVAILR
jgi:hypothetical protein